MVMVIITPENHETVHADGYYHMYNIAGILFGHPGPFLRDVSHVTYSPGDHQ